MNKKAKIAAVAVSAVMAGTMAFGMFGCSKAPTSSGSAGYATTVRIAAGNSNDASTSISYKSLNGQITLSDGVTYQNGDLKPAWQALSERLEVGIEDVWPGAANAGDHLPDAIGNKNGYTWNNIDIITSNLSKITGDTKPSLLNLYDYLDMMPNLTNFLAANPVVTMSVMQNMEEGKEELYATPYFDGNDDFERYVIARRDWVEKVLDGEAFTKSTTKIANNKAKAEAEHKSASSAVAVEVVDPETEELVTIYKNYPNVITQLGTADSALATAFAAACGGTAATIANNDGNIVTIMNAAMNTGNATGVTLTNLYRAYVDACYTTTATATTKYYDGTTHKRSELFNGANAAWDVDDLVAMLRCIIHSPTDVAGDGMTTAGIFTRDASFDRTPDLMMLTAMLYGVRGAASRYEYTYIKHDGSIGDMRNDLNTYEAVGKMHNLYAEGLIGTLPSTAGGNIPEYRYTKNADDKIDGFMMFDYVQTQTLYGFAAEDDEVTSYKVAEGYDFAPIVTPLAKWDMDGDNTYDDYIRYHESWRSVKTNGWVVNKNVANDPAKLNKVLQLIDFMYSQEGQILMSYGPMAKNAQSEGGFWYNQVATEQQIAKGEYFVYRGVKYAGQAFGTRYTPTMTQKTMDQFKGKSVNGFALSEDATVGKAVLSFTDYARKVMGAALPIGIVKDQGFENQMTSEKGKDGSAIVGLAGKAGAIVHPYLDIDPDHYELSEIPTSFPFKSEESQALNADSQKPYRALTTKVGSSKSIYSIFTAIIMGGFDQTDVENVDSAYGTTLKYNIPKTAEATMTFVCGANNVLATTRLNQVNAAWNRLRVSVGLTAPSQS